MKAPILLSLAVLLALSATAAAQTSKIMPGANPCASGRATVGAGDELKAPNADKGKTLSEHLAQTGGVICPPEGVDPEIKAPTPQGGPMPVIPPPGSPGGDQSVQPK